MFLLNVKLLDTSTDICKCFVETWHKTILLHILYNINVKEYQRATKNWESKDMGNTGHMTQNKDQQKHPAEN